MEAASWNTEAMSRATDINRITIQRWLKDMKPVPPDVAAHMRTVRDWHQAHPFVRTAGDRSKFPKSHALIAEAMEDAIYDAF
jgi:hypothetical protein